MAIDLARGITRSDREFREGNEKYGLTANEDAFSLFRQDVGFIGMGDLGKRLYPCYRRLDAVFGLMILGCRKIF